MTLYSMVQVLLRIMLACEDALSYVADALQALSSIYCHRVHREFYQLLDLSSSQVLQLDMATICRICSALSHFAMLQGQWSAGEPSEANGTCPSNSGDVAL